MGPLLTPEKGREGEGVGEGEGWREGGWGQRNEGRKKRRRRRRRTVYGGCGKNRERERGKEMLFFLIDLFIFLQEQEKYWSLEAASEIGKLGDKKEKDERKKECRLSAKCKRKDGWSKRG